MTRSMGIDIINSSNCFRYIKIFMKFPKDTEAFWDDTHYIHYIDPHVRGRYQLWQNLEAKGQFRS